MTTTETLREACPTCDRVECKTLDRGAKDFWADKWARDECREHAVDWRKRALAAEATHVAAPAAIGINVLRFAPAGPVTITAPQRNDLLRMIDDAESRLRTLTTEAAAGTGGEPRKVDEILTGDALTWATMSRAQLAAEHEVLRRQLLTAREQIAVLVALRRGEP